MIRETGKPSQVADECVHDAASGEPDANQTPPARVPWAVDRWGRFISGSSMLVFTGLGLLLHNEWWFIGTMLAAANLIITALSGWCPINRLLLRLGMKEREDIFLPGGSVRPEVLASRTRRAVKSNDQNSTC
jgi:hypothetical protein